MELAELMIEEMKKRADKAFKELNYDVFTELASLIECYEHLQELFKRENGK